MKLVMEFPQKFLEVADGSGEDAFALLVCRVSEAPEFVRELRRIADDVQHDVIDSRRGGMAAVFACDPDESGGVRDA